MPRLLRLTLISFFLALTLVIGYISFIWVGCTSADMSLGRVHGSSGPPYQCVGGIK